MSSSRETKNTTTSVDNNQDPIETLSVDSELILSRIQNETNRLRKKTQERRDSADASSVLDDDDEENDVPILGTAATASRNNNNNHTPNKSPVTNISLNDSQENSINLRPTSPTGSHRSLSSNNEELKADESFDDTLLILQRGDSLAEKNHFETSATFQTNNTMERTASQNSSTGALNYYLGLTNKMFDDLAKKEADDEAFQKKLIDEVLGKDADDKVSMEKVVMLIWQFRDDKEVIKFLTRFVCKFAGSRDVFDGIEFYLPQLAHMMIHLKTEWDDAILERFSLVIAQQSIHFALQLNWILAGAMEDYQPELPDGTPNPTYNPLYYFRCVKLLTNIERCVVYRRPRSQELQRLYEKGNITKAEMHNMEQADRRFTAMQISNEEGEEEKEIFNGTLKYKRAVRTGMFKFKRWKTRHFAIEERMLNCYNYEGGKLVRSIPLEGATVEHVKHTKYPNMISVTNRSYTCRMRASSEEDRNKWITMLKSEATTQRVFGHTDGSLFLENKDAQRVIDELTPSQRNRYKFYRNEREFVRRLTDIAEELRFKEPAERKQAAPGLLQKLEIPSAAYSPLMSSTDIFRRIHSSLYQNTRVFNTKARCPTVMYFLGVRGELEYKGKRHANMDIAEYIHLKFDKASPDGEEEETPVVKKIPSTIQEGSENNSGSLETSPSKEIREAEERTSLFTPEKERPSTDDRSTSLVWSGSLEETPAKATNSTIKGPTSPMRANRHLKRFLKESMVKVPRKLANHLEKKERRNSRANTSNSNLSSSSAPDSSKSLGKTKVPIVASRRASGTHGIGEDIFIGKSSVMHMEKSKIIKGNTNAGGIDSESMNRAKKIICGGQTWAEKSFQMLENVKDKPKDEKVHLEIVSLLSKSNDDLRQEVFVMQMIHYYKSVFIAAGIPLWLKTYKILSTSASTGLLEFMVDSTSLDGLKKSEYYPAEGGLRKYFETTYGGSDSKSFKVAQRNFVQSLAAYSVVCYLLGLKDRHNGNIMIDMRGHLIHIDYGFCLGMCVGHEFTMERAPFKLTEEYVEVMGGYGSEAYREFERLFVAGMVEARSKSHIALGLVEIMMYQSNYPCFSGRRYGGGQALKGFRQRLMLNVPENQVESRAKALIAKAHNHWGTRAYDAFQHWSNGYAI